MATIKCLLHEAGHISRTRLFIQGDDLRVHYGEIDLMVSATAIALKEAGIYAGERVALYLENDLPHIVLALALIRAGAVACPISTRLPPLGVKDRLDSVHCRRLIARVSESTMSLLENVDCLHPDALIRNSLASGQAADRFDIPMDQPATIFFTSGSQGVPKAVLHTYGQHYYSAYGANLAVRVRTGDRWLLSLPLYHVGGMGIVFRCIQGGGTVVIMKANDDLKEMIVRHEVHYLSLVPTQLRRLLEADLPEASVKRLKGILLGGSPCPASLIEEAYRRKWPMLPSYGLTETNALVTMLDRSAPHEKRGTAGKGIKHREVRISPDGEIQVRGATRFSGYVEGERVVQPFDADGWYSTGDLGSMDEEGYLTVHGRRDNQFISGGENIQPEHIERALLAVPGVAEAIVVPVESTEYGARPVAFIRMTSDELPDAPSLSDAVAQVRPRYEVPIAFYPWPMEVTGEGIKISRAEFEAIAAMQMRLG